MSYEKEAPAQVSNARPSNIYENIDRQPRPLVCAQARHRKRKPPRFQLVKADGARTGCIAAGFLWPGSGGRFDGGVMVPTAVSPFRSKRLFLRHSIRTGASVETDVIRVHVFYF